MNTPSHWLMTIAAGKLGPWKDRCPRWALGLGSIAPDIPLYFLSFGGIWYYRSVKGWEPSEIGQHLFQNLYYKDPVWIGLHNFLHSPTMLLMLLSVAYCLRNVWPKVSQWTTFFLFACLFHSVIDIVTHFDDGPVMFFPFDWEYRFSSPVSYWDPDHFGWLFFPIEVLVDLAISTWLIWRWREQRKTNAQHSG